MYDEQRAELDRCWNSLNLVREVSYYINPLFSVIPSTPELQDVIICITVFFSMIKPIYNTGDKLHINLTELTLFSPSLPRDN